LPRRQAVLSALFPASWRSPAWNFHDEKSNSSRASKRSRGHQRQYWGSRIQTDQGEGN
jgi:hypothetical protein